MARCLRFGLAAVVLLAMAAAASASTRELKQTCPIWKCGSGCQLEDQLLNGVRRWVCGSCRATYRLLPNKRACVCAAGFYDLDGTRCVRCPLGSYCPQGTGNGPAIQNYTTNFAVANSEDVGAGSRSFLITCGPTASVTTRLLGAKEETACVARAGYSYTLGGGAVCPGNSYNPGFNRLSTCYSCPSSMTTTSTGSTKKSDCLVPAGWTMNRGVLVRCPKGTYREETAAPTGNLACTRCLRGWTTTSTASQLASNCNQLLPGYGGTNVSTVATACAQGTYHSGGGTGDCVACVGYTTRPNVEDSEGNAVGAKSISECVAPPGYRNNGTHVDKCPPNTYAAGWGRRTLCTSCGAGISATLQFALTSDSHGSGVVQAAPTDCFINAGQGMIFDQAAGAYKGVTCPANTYGVAARVHGLSFMPCKPCPRGLYSSASSTSEAACQNYAGYGFNGFTAEACPPGYWAAAGTNAPCQQCPPFRNTTAATSTPFFNDSSIPAGNNGSAQDALGDCKVIPGYGIYNVSTTPDADAVLDTVECAIGYYSLGGEVNTICTTCTFPATNNETASTTCDVCESGFGKVNNAGSSVNCTGCVLGYYQEGDSDTCLSCTSVITSNVFTYQGKSDQVSVNSAVTYPGTQAADADGAGAKSVDQCFPQHYQLDESMGTHLALGDFSAMNSTTAANTTACMGACDISTCLAATWVYNFTTVGSDNTGTCYLTVEGANTTVDLAVKALPWDTVSGQTVGKAAVTSGSYTIHPGHATGDMLGKPITTIGATIGHTAAGTTHSKVVCKEACDNDASCWGFYWASTGTICWLRTGNEAEGARTFVRVQGSLVDHKSGVLTSYWA